jgi:hypothetical protein
MAFIVERTAAGQDRGAVSYQAFSYQLSVFAAGHRRSLGIFWIQPGRGHGDRPDREPSVIIREKAKRKRQRAKGRVYQKPAASN